MKLLKILIIITAVCFTAQLKAQNSALSKKLSFAFIDTPPSYILSHIAHQSNINIGFVPEMIDLERITSFEATRKRTDTILFQLCRKLDLDWQIFGENIQIRPSKDLLKKYRKGELNNPTVIIDGFVREEGSQEVLLGATLYFPDLQYGVATNSYGYFSVEIPKGEHRVIIRMLGYQSQNKILKFEDNQSIKFSLKNIYEALETVTIEDDQKSQITDARIQSTNKIVQMTPGILGENEIIKTFDNIAGVTSQGEASVFFHVRGGNKDQNLILLDEAPIYNPSHFLGLFTSIAPDAIKDVKVHKSAIPIELGGRLSSITEMRTKDGNFNKWGAFMALTPFTSSISLHGPLIKNKWTHYLSFRRSNLRQLTLNQYGIKPYFYDINWKSHFKLNSTNQFYITVYRGTDYFGLPYGNSRETVSENVLFYDIENNDKLIDYSSQGIRTGFAAGWQNTSATLRWNHIFSQKLFVNTSIYVSNYNYRFKIDDFEDLSVAIWREKIENATISQNFTFYKSLKSKQKFGWNLKVHRIDPGNFYGTNNLNYEKVPNQLVRQLTLYWGTKSDLKNNWSLNYGSRVNAWQNRIPRRHFEMNWEIRAGIQKQIDSNTLWSINYDETTQFLTLLNNSVSPLTNIDYWVPASETIHPQKAYQLSLTRDKYLKKRAFYLSSSLYAKYMTNQIDFIDHPQLMLNPEFTSQLRSGYGYSYGFETQFQKQVGRMKMNFAYTFSRTFRKIEEINQNRTYSPYYDRPHALNMNVQYIYSSKLELGISWIYNSGSRFTAPTSTYLFNGIPVPVYSQLNNSKLPDYHRADAQITYHLPKSKNGHLNHFIKLSGTNLYNRLNAIGLNYNFAQNGNNFVIPFNSLKNHDFIATQSYVFGFMLSLNYTLKIN